MNMLRFVGVLCAVWGSVVSAAELPVPPWLLQELLDATVYTSPGVYPLSADRILAVGSGEMPTSLEHAESVAFAEDSAEAEAKLLLGKHFFPELFAKYDNVSVSMKEVYPAYTILDDDSRTVYRGLIAKKENIKAVPVVSSGSIVDADNIMVAQEMLPYLADPVLQNGGAAIHEHNGGWIVVGVGKAKLRETGAQAERKARKFAAARALEEITGAVYGIAVENKKASGKATTETNGVATLERWKKTQTRENIEGYLQQAEEIGSWINQSGYVVVAMAVSDQPLEISFGETTANPIFADWDVDAPWDAYLQNAPQITQGGAVLVVNNNVVWVLGVGAGKLSGNTANDMMWAPRAAATDAQRNIIKYIKGFSLEGNAERVKEVVITNKNGEEASNIIRSVQKKIRQGASGSVRNLQKVGSWKSEDGALLYQAFVAEVMNIG